MSFEFSCITNINQKGGANVINAIFKALGDFLETDCGSLIVVESDNPLALAEGLAKAIRIFVILYI